MPQSLNTLLDPCLCSTIAWGAPPHGPSSARTWGGGMRTPLEEAQSPEESNQLTLAPGEVSQTAPSPSLGLALGSWLPHTSSRIANERRIDPQTPSSKVRLSPAKI